jgi:hypothetical protein
LMSRRGSWACDGRKPDEGKPGVREQGFGS